VLREMVLPTRGKRGQFKRYRRYIFEAEGYNIEGNDLKDRKTYTQEWLETEEYYFGGNYIISIIYGHINVH
jgi:hypothetical protein